MFSRRKKDNISETEKACLTKIANFYNANKEIINQLLTKDMTQSDKKMVIGEFYRLLNYQAFPILKSKVNVPGNLLKVYRGISAESLELLKTYINQYLNGRIHFGKKASIYGTGIYTSLGSKDEASKYSTDGGTKEFGVIIENELMPDINVINYDDIEALQERIISLASRLYTNDQNFDNYLKMLDDCAFFVSILGYDAIYVEKRGYMVIMNRGKIIVDDLDLENQLEALKTKSIK